MNKNDNYTLAYQCYMEYQNKFFSSSGIKEALKERRNFVMGIQYEQVYDDMPRPIFNICKEDIEKTSAKILETKASVSFVSDTDNNSLNELDQFYEYQRSKMQDDKMYNLVVRAGCIDGIGVCFTGFDRDTIGVRCSYKGYLQRQIVPFENTFWENPRISDPQDQRYLGYFVTMDVKSVIDCLEGSEKEIKDKTSDLLAEVDITDTQTDTKQVNVYIRFFRIDGEVCFEMATKTVNIFDKPHFLNPEKNEIDFEIEESEEKEVPDYENQDPTKYLIFQKGKKTTESEHIKSKEKFYRYPVAVFVPYPVANMIIGESKVAQDIPNQKIINYTNLLSTLIMQSHAMPKILVKPEALRDQEYDNSPNQILTDYTPITSGTQWGISRLSSGDAVNSNLVDFANSYIEMTRQINGFADLTSAMSANMSGYLFEQAQRQQNLTLQQPQKRFWEFIGEVAKTDLLFFKHYIDEVDFYVVREDTEIGLEENYRDLALKLNAKDGVQEQLPSVNKVLKKTIDSKFFDGHFDVNVEVEQGVAGSQISESQHINELWQYISAGNISADKIQMLMEIDPAISRKTRQKFSNSLEALSMSQLEMANQEIAQLKGTLENVLRRLDQNNQIIKRLQMVDKARSQAFNDSLKTNEAIAEASISQPKLSESEVKSNNAKGKSGTSFS